MFFFYNENRLLLADGSGKSNKNIDFLSENIVNLIGEEIERKIMFFDLMLLILSKILLLSGWEKVNAYDDNNINYFYDSRDKTIEFKEFGERKY